MPQEHLYYKEVNAHDGAYYRRWVSVYGDSRIGYFSLTLDGYFNTMLIDGQSTLMLVCARLCHVAATSWGSRRYMNMDHLFKPEDDQLSDIIAG